MDRFSRVRVGGHLVGRFWRSASPAARWPHIDPGRLEVGAGCFAPHTGSLLDPPQRPAQPSQCKNLLSFFVAQYVAHTGGGYNASRRRQRPERLISLAGFQVTTYGRVWVTTEDQDNLYKQRRNAAIVGDNELDSNQASQLRLGRI